MAINQATLFQNVPDEKIYMNEYDLGFDNTFTTEVGRNAVIFCRRVLPGESWSVAFQAFVRTMPLWAPVFGKFDMYAHAFYCTNRILSNVWQDYIRGGQDGDPTVDDPEHEPDLLEVTNSSDNFDLRESISYEEIDTVSAQLTPDGNNVYRPMFYHGSLSDYLGIGSWAHVGTSFGDTDTFLKPFKFSLLPFKAYQSIWSEYYADANVMIFDDMDTIEWSWIPKIHKVHVSADPGSTYVSCLDQECNETPLNYDQEVIMKNLFRMRNRCYAKDYFTSSLPEPQRGPDVLIPMSADIEIENDFSNSSPVMMYPLGEHTTPNFLGFDLHATNRILMGSASQQDTTQQEVDFIPNSTAGIALYNAENLKASISELSATITDLRTAVALQEFYESSARYGNRYKEFVYGHFGSMIPDDQLTRPWYLGGCKFPLMVGDVMQTAPGTDGNSNVGDLYGKGVSATDGDGFLFKRQFSDYGLIMIIFSIRPHNYYKNTIQKEWTIEDRLDEYWRKLQAVGEESVYNWELHGFLQDSSASVERSEDIFGYQMRYSYYKFNNDEVHGDFKGDLDDWTLCRDFSSGVTLSPEFLTVSPIEFNHIFQYTGIDRDHFLVQSHLSVIREAPMDIYSIPRIN